MFCRTTVTEEVKVPLISPVKPLTTPKGRICLCHKIKNDFQTQPALQSGFLRPNWLAVERVRKSCSRDCRCTRGADTLSPGTHANTSDGEVMPPTPLWTLRTQSSDRKLAQNMRFSHLVGVAGLSSFRTTSRLGHRERSNRDPCSGWYYVFFPFKICNHSGTSGHADTEAPAWQSSCHSISQWHRLGVLPLGLEQVNDPRILGSFSDLKRSSRVNILFPSTCSFPWFS